MQSIKLGAMRDHRLVRAVLLAIDDSGVTRQRELHIEARGTAGRADRERARYIQAGVVSARDLGTLRLDGIEASLGGSPMC